MSEQQKKRFILDDEALWGDNRPDRPLILSEKIEEARRTLRLSAEMSKTYYNAPLIITYSGGKDSDVMLHLAETTLQPDAFEVLNSHTTVDAPETVYHIRNTFERLRSHGIKTSIDYHIQEDGKPMTMWKLIPKKLMPPTRIARYCCQVLKESGTPNRIASLGVREAESSKRQGRDIFAIRGGGRTNKQSFFHLTTQKKYTKKQRNLTRRGTVN